MMMSSRMLLSSSTRIVARRPAVRSYALLASSISQQASNRAPASVALTALSKRDDPNATVTATTTTITTRSKRTQSITQMQKAKNKKKPISGNRGSRGHGWFLKYRQGRGGRHLQGEYWDRQQQHYDMETWNDAVLGLGSQFVYLDIAMEDPKVAAAAAAAAAAETSANAEEHEEIEIDVSANAVDEEDEGGDGEDPKTAPSEETATSVEAAEAETTPATTETSSAIETTTATEASAATTETIAATEAPTEATEATTETPAETGPVERLIIQVASTVMPETCINFIGLCQDAAYNGTILYRIEKEVGLCGGDVLTNTGKTGQCWQDWPNMRVRHPKLALKPNPLRHDLPPPSEEPLAMWHIAGTVAMLCPKVNEIDSRFILCGKDAPHLDGVHRAFGKLDAASLAKVQDWQANVLTYYGKPRSATLRIVGCGVLEHDSTEVEETDPVSTQEAA